MKLIFDDGFGTPTGKRYCMNLVCLSLKPKENEKNTTKES